MLAKLPHGARVNAWRPLALRRSPGARTHSRAGRAPRDRDPSGHAPPLLADPWNPRALEALGAPRLDRRGPVLCDLGLPDHRDPARHAGVAPILSQLLRTPGTPHLPALLSVPGACIP